MDIEVVLIRDHILTKSHQHPLNKWKSLIVWETNFLSLGLALSLKVWSKTDTMVTLDDATKVFIGGASPRDLL
jgi:hypothetical protein